MFRRRPAAVIGTLCVAFALVGAPTAPEAQAVGPGFRVVVTELPVLSELPPLPAAGETPEEEDDDEEGSAPFGMSGVQSVALALALAALVAGGVGLAVVTRRGLGDPADERPPRPGRIPPHHSR